MKTPANPDVLENCQRPQASPPATLLGALVEFVEDKIAIVQKDLTAREQMEATWRGGTDESWRAAGCKLSRTGRLHESAVQGRIAARKRYEVDMFKKVIEALKAPNDKAEPLPPDGERGRQ